MTPPIEIVRAQSNWWKHELCGFPPHTQDELYTALASVLRDAERFKALERAHDGLAPQAWCSIFLGEWNTMDGTLAELADRLREGAK